MSNLPPSPFLDPAAPPASAHSAVTPRMGDGRLSRFVLDEEAFMAAIEMPAFLANPSWQYLDAVRRA